MTDTITVTGVVGSDPRVHVTTPGTRDHLVPPRLDAAVLRPREGHVGGRRDQLVHRLRRSASSRSNAAASVAQGRARRRPAAGCASARGRTARSPARPIEIEADSIGHDLAWGTTTPSRRSRRESAAEAEPPAAAVRGRRMAGRRIERPSAGGLDGADAGRGSSAADRDGRRRRSDVDDARARGRRREAAPTSRRPPARASRPDRLDSARAVAAPPDEGNDGTAIATSTAVLALAGAVVVPSARRMHRCRRAAGTLGDVLRRRRAAPTPAHGRRRPRRPTLRPDLSGVREPRRTSTPVNLARRRGERRRPAGATSSTPSSRPGSTRPRCRSPPTAPTVDLQADSVQFAVLFDDECLVGQYGPASGGYHSAVRPALGTGGCLVGETRPIDW